MKILKIAAAAVAVLIAGVVVVLLTVDVSQYKGVIESQAKAATGRDVTIGDIKLSLSLTPALVLTDVAVANAPWGSRPQMLTLKQLEASTQLIPLLFGTVNISGLKMIDPDVVFETNAQGRGNWEFDTAGAAPAPPAAGEEPVPFNVSGVTVEGLKLAYRDGRTKGAATFAAKTADVDIEGALTDLTIPSVAVTELQGSYTQGAMAGQGSAADLSFNAVGPLTDFNITKLVAKDVKGAFKDGPSSYEASVASLDMTGVPRVVSGKESALDIAAALKAMNVTALALENATAALKDANGATTAAIGKVAIDAKGRIGDLGITNLAVTNGKLTMTGKGESVDAEMSSLTLNEAGALSLTAKISGQDVRANGTLAPIATLARMEKGFPAKLAFEGMGLKGNSDLNVTVVKGRPVARGALTIPELDLSAFTQQAPSSDRLFTNDPLPWGELNAGDANVKMSIGKLTLQSGLVLSNVTLPVELIAGKMQVSGASFAVAGGTVSGDVAMNANDKSFALKAVAKDLTAENLAREMKKGDLIQQGPLDLNINVRGVGDSTQAIAASMSGAVIAGMGESRIRSGALDIVGADIIMQVLGAINPIGNKDPYTVARCGVVNLQINNGVGTTTNGIALVTDKMHLTSSGTVNFGTERVDLSFRPTATGGLGLGLGALAQSVKVTGPLAAPSIGIDQAGAVKALGTLGAAFATGGLSALAQGAKNRVEGGGDPCQIARTWHLKK